jgi:predicted patatin/cPLA2 family phospholipase
VIDGVRYVDGGVATPVPFDVPELDPYPGPTLVVLTRPATTSKPGPRWYETGLVNLLVPPVARRAVLLQHELHNATMRRLQAAESERRVLVSNPPPNMPLKRFSTDEVKVFRGIDMGIVEGRRLAARLANV